MKFLELTIVLFLFLGPPICVLLGWSNLSQSSNSYIQSVHPLLYLLIIYSIFKFKHFIKNKFFFYNAIFILLFTFTYKVLFTDFIFSRFVGNLLTPLLFSFFALEVSKNRASLKLCSKFFIALFIIEVSLSIYERITQTLVFPYTLFNPEDLNGMALGVDFFRSNSLLGHPLSNAICVSVILTFIATSNISSAKKIVYISLGFVSILAFNARFALLISLTSFIIYYIFKNKFSVINFVSLILLLSILFYFAINLNFGDRILSLSMNQTDSSTMARLDIFDMLKFLDVNLIYRGIGLSFVEKRLGIMHIENWLLIILFDLGCILTFYFVYLIFKIIFINLKNYPTIDKFYIIFVFIVIASSNNSLATQVPAIAFISASRYFINTTI